MDVQNVLSSTSPGTTSKTTATMIFLRNALLSTLALLLSHAAASSTRLSSVAMTPPTCPSRTVNYITHGLPQQCLATSRALPVNDTVSTTFPSLNNKSSNVHNVSTDQDQLFSLGFAQKTTAVSSTWPSPATHVSNAESDTMLQDDPSSIPSAIPVSSTESATVVGDSEADSMLDNAKFLSFEDWKKEILVKAGQSEHVGAGRQNDRRDTAKRSTPALQQGLDALGDDAEIDLDFTGFVADRPDLSPPQQPLRAIPEDSGLNTEQEPAIPSGPRSKDAGTTCKERYNYASFDCAATVLKKNPEAKGEKFVLLENKDSYMLNVCSADNKFLILELCNDILIDTIVLANFEFFSSIFRTFRVSVSDKYPVKTDKWITLGTFEARNSREIQAFLVDNPMIWARYVRFEFLTHYGNEFYCPLSLVRVHGTTMMEDYKHDIQSALSDEDGEDEEIENIGDLEPEETLVPEAVAHVLIEERSRSEEAGRALQTLEQSEALVSSVTKGGLSKSEQLPELESSWEATSPNTYLKNPFLSLGESGWTPSTSHVSSTLSPVSELVDFSNTVVTATDRMLSSAVASSATSDAMLLPTSETRKATSTSRLLTSSIAMLNSTSSIPPNSTHTSHKANNATTTERSKATISSTQAQPASPTIQESFFKSVQKRLQMLESNSSLSLQYIEEQSRALRDAFGRVEQKQMSKTTNFLDYLNATVLNELRDFRQQYDQLWQSTVIELETQREQYQQENLAINSRLAILTDELLFQKRMSILQMVLILICLGLVLFSRGPMNNYMDVPVLHNMLTRSPNNRWTNISGLQTPSASPPQTRPSSSHHAKPIEDVLKRHSRDHSDDSMNSIVQQQQQFSTMTPVSNEVPSDEEIQDEGTLPESPIYDPSEIARPSTSPPVLPGTEGKNTPEFVAIRDGTIAGRLLHASQTELDDGNSQLPELVMRPATPIVKHLTFQLPDE